MGGLRPNALPSVKGGDSPLCRSFSETEPPPFHFLGLLCLNRVGVGLWGRVGSSGFDAAPKMQPQDLVVTPYFQGDVRSLLGTKQNPADPLPKYRTKQLMIRTIESQTKSLITHF